MSDQIVVISGKIEEVNIPELVDIIISEPMGYMLFNERMLETYLHAKKWLKPGGKMFPSQGDLHITPFTDDALYLEQFSKANFWYQPSFHGVDLTGLRDLAISEYFKQPVVDTFDIRICLAKTHKFTVDFETAVETDLHDINIPVSFTLQQSGSVHGLAFWFDVAFNGSQSTVWLSTSPTQPLTHWYQVRCLLPTPIFVRAGQTLEGTVHLRSNVRQSYDVDIELYKPGSGVMHTNSLDLKNPCFRYTGQPIQPPPGTNHCSPTDAYWNQQDATVDQNQADTSNIVAVNGDGAHYIQLQQSGAVYNNYMPPANLMAGLAGINPGSIPSPAVVSQAAGVQSLAVDAALSAGFLGHSASVATRTQFPLTNQLMIGDYVVPNNVILPSAQGSINILQYKAVGEL
jgi:histone-arginine methyltransferase CARM1